MTEQTAFALTACVVGFVSAIFFCIGNALNTSNKILIQATPFYDFSHPVASSLAAQRSQYVVGALLLLISFCLQIAAALASSANIASLPRYLDTWYAIAAAVLLPTVVFAGVLARYLFASTMSKVQRLEQARRAKEK